MDLQYDNETPSSLRFDIGRASGVTPSDGLLGDDDFTLHVGTQTFAIDAPGVIKSFTFPDHGLSWTVGGTVTVRLVKNPPSDATLSTLAVNDGTNDLTLDPTFASATYVYATDLDNAITTVTLTATLNDDTAEVSAVTLAGTAIADSDFSDGISVPSLVVGDNVIVVTVTAQDASTQEYSITVESGNPLRRGSRKLELHPRRPETPSATSSGSYSSQRPGAALAPPTSHPTTPGFRTRWTPVTTTSRPTAPAFKVLGCTEDVDARDNTSTTATGVPTYWLGGNKVADDYPDLYDRNWDDEANPRNERAEIDHNTTADNDMIWTGCKHNGTEVFLRRPHHVLSAQAVSQAGKLNRTAPSQGPLESSELITNNANRPMYGLSDLFRVVAADSNNPPVFTDGATQTRSFAEGEGRHRSHIGSDHRRPIPGNRQRHGYPRLHAGRR